MEKEKEVCNESGKDVGKKTWKKRSKELGKKECE